MNIQKYKYYELAHQIFSCKYLAEDANSCNNAAINNAAENGDGFVDKAAQKTEIFSWQWCKYLARGTSASVEKAGHKYLQTSSKYLANI